MVLQGVLRRVGAATSRQTPADVAAEAAVVPAWSDPMLGDRVPASVSRSFVVVDEIEQLQRVVDGVRRQSDPWQRVLDWDSAAANLLEETSDDLIKLRRELAGVMPSWRGQAAHLAGAAQVAPADCDRTVVERVVLMAAE